MRKVLMISLMILSGIVGMNAQKVAVIDMDYILKAIPQYESANDQLNQLSAKWQKDYQTELVFLTPEMKKQRENDIIAKERQVNEKKKQYFGAEGELFKKRNALIKPIQDEIYNAIQELSNTKKYDLIIDKNSNIGIIFASPKIDISDEVLSAMGYSK